MNARSHRKVAASLALALASFASVSLAATLSIDNSGFSAGGRQASASYTNDGSLGGIGGTGAVSTTTARHGFAGQLTEVQSVIVSSSPTTVNEGATRQLSALALLDDATWLVLAGTNVTWSVASGAVNSISAGGLATAATVYQDSVATVRGDYRAQFGTLALTVLNVSSDDYGTYAADGIDDAWQVANFGIGNASAGPMMDPDGDGQNNLFEYLAGTSPTNSASRFLLSLSLPTATQRSLIFSPITAGRTYTVEFATNLSAGGFVTLTGAAQADNASTRTVTDSGVTNAVRYYRVRISLP